MKFTKYIALGILSISMLSMAGCSEVKEEKIDVQPQVTQMKAICELATMECFYHNVAKYSKEDAEKFLFWTKDMEFWIEYEGKVTLGLDVSQISMEIEGDQVNVTLPRAKVLSIEADKESISKKSFIVADDSAEPTAEDETAAFKKAQEDMKKRASEDTVLLNNAQQRAQILLEEYVNNIGEAVGKDYVLVWKYID